MQRVGVHQTIGEHMVPGAFVVGLLGMQQLPHAWLGLAVLSWACLGFAGVLPAFSFPGLGCCRDPGG